MNFQWTDLRKRQCAAGLAIASIILLGCASKVQIRVPGDFHGHVHIQCTGATQDHTSTIRVDGTGSASVANCPVRQVDTVVTRSGGTVPVNTAVMWTTTGDGLVREINFDVR